MGRVQERITLDKIMFTYYIKLLKKIDEQLRQLADCRCPPQCDQCCRITFSLFPVEAYYLWEAFCRMPSAMKDQVRKQLARDQTHQCPFLIDRKCTVYLFRPVICRSHGYPFFRRQEEDGSAEIFPGCECLPLESMARNGNGSMKVSAFDLDQMNTLLAAVNDHFLQESGLLKSGVCERIPVEQVPSHRFAGGDADADL